MSKEYINISADVICRRSAFSRRTVSTFQVNFTLIIKLLITIIIIIIIIIIIMSHYNEQSKTLFYNFVKHILVKYRQSDNKIHDNMQ